MQQRLQLMPQIVDLAVLEVQLFELVVTLSAK